VPEAAWHGPERGEGAPYASTGIDEHCAAGGARCDARIGWAARATSPEQRGEAADGPAPTELAISTVGEWLFGFASLIACLAALAAVPVLNLLSLGYLLDASGRVARSGRIRDGFIDIPKFARLGSLAAGTWLCLLVPRFVASLASDAWLIAPGSPAAQAWRIGLVAVTLLTVGHVLLAWASGGRLRHFFWPLLAPFQLLGRLVWGSIVRPVLRPLLTRIWPSLADDLFALRPLTDWFPPAIVATALRRGGVYRQARDAVYEFLASLRLSHYFWLGLRGFVGGLAWLLIPSLMLMAGTSGRGPATILVGYGGALLLGWVLLHLAFLQTNFAAQNRVAALFDWRETARQAGRAPIACWFALTVTLLLAIPLFLLKIEPPPRELWWTLTIFFIVFMYPARLVTGWAVARANRRHEPRLFVMRWLGRAAAVPVIAFYIFILFFTQYTSYLGPASLLEQHAFLVPVPFLALR
jgi:hypothetical protein